MQKLLKGARASFFMGFMMLGFMTLGLITTALHAMPLTIHSHNKVHDFNVDVANTPRDLAKGLMHRKILKYNEGMLFIFPQKKKLCFWMKNTYVPLDILILDEAGEVLEILYDMDPHSLKARCSKKTALRAIELKGGICHDRGIRPGDMVKTPNDKQN